MKKILLLILAITITNCTKDSPNDLEPIVNQSNENETNKVTYTLDIAPIINGNCTSCHKNPPINGANSNLTTFKNVKTLSNTILDRISKNTGESGSMPIGGPRLSQTKIDLFEQWILNDLAE